MENAYVEPLDLSDAPSAEAAAESITVKLRELADAIGQKAELEVSLIERDGHHEIHWPGGPHDWSVRVTGGEPILAGAPEIQGFRDCDGFHVDCKSGVALSVYPE